MKEREFHLSNGLYFKRMEDGAVRIRLTEEPKIDSPTVFELIVDDASWASVMASVCNGGEDGDTYQQALDFHNNN